MGLSKCYRIYNHPRDRLIQALWGRDRRCKPKRFFRDFWALQELSFSLRRGQTLGVIGRNGSGKSTLLQLLCGTLEPTTGEVQVRGRVGALLELGSGFNPEFSGLENVFFNAALLGLSKAETDQRLDQILGFADIGEFISQPVKAYSSGMAMRLAFAVQAHIDPDVLVVDEALAVGDELFQKKCYDHLNKLKDQGTAVLLVTHSCPQIIQHCDQALLLHKGKARMLAEPARVTVTYQRLMNASDQVWEEEFKEMIHGEKPEKPEITLKTVAGDVLVTDTPANRAQHLEQIQAWLDTELKPQTTQVYPSRGATIRDCWVETDKGERVNVLPFGQDFKITIVYTSESDLTCIGFACHLANHTGLRITGQTVPASINSSPGHHITNIAAGSEWQVSYSFSGGLWPGVYFVGGGIVTCKEGITSFVHRVIDFRAIRILDSKPLSVIGAASLQIQPPIITGLHLDQSVVNQ